MKNGVKAVEITDFMDEEWYKSRYPDVELLGIGAAEHYLRIGARLHRNPSSKFDTAYYLHANPDVSGSGMNPLLHYIRYGQEEGRRCTPAQAAPASAASFRAVRDVQQPATRVKSILGLRSRREGAKTILVCAHITGRHLFGGERSFLDIVEGFDSLGYNVVAVIPGGGGEYVQALRQMSLEVLSFRYPWWTKGQPLDEHAISEFAHIIEAHAIDAVHVNTIMLREPLVAARRMAVPAVLHAREIISHDESLCGRIGEDPEYIVEKIVASTDWIIANSLATARCFSAGTSIRVVSNTVDSSMFDVRPRTPDGFVRIGMVSSNLLKKGVLDLVAVAALLMHRQPNAKFVLIGPENFVTDQIRTEQKAGAHANVEIAGYRDDPGEAMAEVDIVLNLSHFQESFGRTVLEAMACGRPTVVYDWGALPELVSEGVTGYALPFRDVEAVAEKLIILCNSPALLARMGAAARLVARRNYSRQSYAENLRAAYQDILEHAPVGASERLVLPARSAAIQSKPLEEPRIAYFLWHFPVPSETFVLNELRILVETGCDVMVFCKQSPHKDFVPDFQIRWSTVSGVDDFAEKLREHQRTIVHSHFVYPTVTEMVWPACEAAGIEFTFIAHAQDIFRYVNDRRNRIGEVGRSPNCLQVIVPSRFHRKYLEERGVPASKLVINPNGIDPSLYEHAATTNVALRRHRSICAIHRFTEKKGLEILIRAGVALELQGVSIHLYGYGHLGERYRSLIDQLGVGNVFVHGAVGSREEMLEVLSNHDLFACPSVRAEDGDMDGIPTVLMEAMAAGIPVLATDISGIPDLVIDKFTGIVCDASPDSIVKATLAYYAMPTHVVQAMAGDAKRRVTEMFDAKKLTQNLLRIWSGKTIDVAIVSWNNLPQLYEVIRRLIKFTSLPWHLIVCDNGSEPNVVAHLCDLYAVHDNVTVVLNRENAYVGPGTNTCIEHGQSDYVVYVCGKEGFTFDYGWEKSFIEHMDQNPSVGQAGTLCYSPSYLTGRDYPAGVPLFAKFRNQGYAEANPEKLFAHVQGGFFVVRRSMYDQIGGFSSDVPHNYTDVEYSYFVESMGWELGSVRSMLALYNKTRPNIFSRLDESMLAIHPPTMDDLPTLDAIVGGENSFCNICQHLQPRLDAWLDDYRCSGCGASAADRSLYRFLAESTLTYRRLPAIGFGVGESMKRIWSSQFQGALYNADSLDAAVEKSGRLPYRDGSLRFAYVDAESGLTDVVAKEIRRVLSRDALVLYRPDRETLTESGGVASSLENVKVAFELDEVESLRYASSVLRYDAVPFVVGRRLESGRCVS